MIKIINFRYLLLVGFYIFSFNAYSQDINLKLNDLISSIDKCGLNTDVSIGVEITNIGTLSAEEFNISYKINGQYVVTEKVTSPLLPDDTLEYYFTKKASLYSRQYEKINFLQLIVNADGDIDPNNDSLEVLFNTYGQWVDHFGWSSFNICDGLIDQSVMGISEDLNGNYWIGTQMGVSFYDENIWTNYTSENSGLVNNYIESILIDASGNLWAGTFGYGVSFFDGLVWTNYTTLNSNIGSDIIEDIYEDNSGNIWFATDEGLSVFDGLIWTNYTTANSSLPNNSTYCLMQDVNDNIWVGTAAGVAVFDGADFNTIYNNGNSGLPDDFVYSIAEDNDLNIWIGTFNGGLTKYDGLGWQVFNTANSPLESNAVLSLNVDKNNSIWIGSFNGGAYKYSDGSWEIFNTSNFLQNNAFWGKILPDSKGNIWFPTYNGLVKKHCDLPTFSHTKIDVSTEGGNDGQIDITPPGDPADLNFEWSNGATSEDLTNLPAGDYTIQITDLNGCFISDTIEIVEPEAKPCIADASYTYSGKYNNTTGFTDVQFKNLSTGNSITYYWEFGDGKFSDIKEPVHTYEQSGLYNCKLTVYDVSDGCMDYIEREVEIGDISCNADFVYFYSDSNLEINFTEKTSGIANSFYWEFGDGNYSYEKDPVHLFSSAGIYNVCFTSRDTISGCQSKSCVNVTAGTIECKADFSYVIDAENRIVRFTDKSIGAITNWYWTLGDGKTTAELDPIHLYSKPGDYNVCLHISGIGENNYSDICKEIQIGALPCNIEASFNYFIDNDLNKINLSDNSLGRRDTWFWDLGDGFTATGPETNHTYSEPGKYLISLSVRDTINSCIDFYSEFVQVGNPQCFADFNYVISEDLRTITFNNKSRLDSEVWYWEFGDGTSSQIENPIHLYDQPGIYNVILTVSNTDGSCSDQLAIDIQIDEIICQADFITSIDSINQTAYFNPIITGNYTSLQWTFGDGGVSNLETPSHTYPAPGYYTVKLTSYDEPTGCMSASEKVILMASPGIDCNSNFYYQVNDDTKTVTFFNRSQGNNLEYEWDFGDGSNSNLENPVHIFEIGGFYNVCLTAKANDTVYNERCKFIRVAPDDATNCLSSFYYFIDSTQLLATFVDISEGNPDNWLWDFNDGNGSDTQHPSHQYTDPEYYQVHLFTLNEATGCRSDYFELINVGMEGDGIQAKFDYYVDTTANKKASGNPVDFVGVSIGDKTSLKYSFGDGAADSSNLVYTHVYEEPGIYYVCLSVTDKSSGLTDTYCENVNTIGKTGIIRELSKGPEINLYPNPTADYISIEFYLNKPQYIKLNLIDIQSKNLIPIINSFKSIQEQKLILNLQNYSPGIYILQLITEEGISNKKISKY